MNILKTRKLDMLSWPHEKILWNYWGWGRQQMEKIKDGSEWGKNINHLIQE